MLEANVVDSSLNTDRFIRTSGILTYKIGWGYFAIDTIALNDINEFDICVLT